jgi:hypothetical protein
LHGGAIIIPVAAACTPLRSCLQAYEAIEDVRGEHVVRGIIVFAVNAVEKKKPTCDFANVIIAQGNLRRKSPLAA